MILFQTILIILFILIAGYSAINLMQLSKLSVLEKIPYSWGLGVGLIASQLFLYSALGIFWSKNSILVPWIILICFSFWKFRITKPNLKIKKLEKFEKIFLTLLLSLLIFTAVESVIRPVTTWDGWSNWLLRPKVFYLNNNLSLDYVKYTTDQYPLTIPLMSTFDYKMIGEINDQEVLLLFFVFYLMIAILFFSKSEEIIGRKWALIFTFLLMSSQNLIRHGGRFEAGQADLALGFFIFACASTLLSFIKTNNYKILFLLNIFLGITALIKNDGIPIFLIGNLITLYYILKSKNLLNLTYLIPSIFLFGSWYLYKYLNNYPKNFISGSGAFHLNEIGSIIFGMTKEFLNFQNWNLLWIVFLISLIIYRKNIRKIFPIFLLFLFQWIFYVIAFILSPFPLAADHVNGIINRLYIHIAPLALFITVLLLSFNKELKNFFKK